MSLTKTTRKKGKNLERKNVLNTLRKKKRALRSLLKIWLHENTEKQRKSGESIAKRKDLVKKALFGEVLKKQLQENFSEMKTEKEKKAFNL